MERKNSHFLVKLIAIALVISLCAPIGVHAAVPETIQPMASAYLMSYTAYICAMGEGELQIWFSVTGTGTQEYLGALSVLVYESTDNQNWYWVKSFLHQNNESMLAQNTYAHMNYVTHQGVPGRYYKAYVGIWGGPADSGDSRYFWTPVELCT